MVSSLDHCMRLCPVNSATLRRAEEFLLSLVVFLHTWRSASKIVCTTSLSKAFLPSGSFMLMFAILRSTSWSSWLILNMLKVESCGVASIILIRFLFIWSAVPCGLRLKMLTICWSATKPESGWRTPSIFMIGFEFANTSGMMDGINGVLGDFAACDSRK